MKKHLVLLFMLLVSCYAFAQNRTTVTGTVTDAITGDPIVGVSVVVKGTQIGTATSIDGDFSLPNVPDNAILSISFLGMKSMYVPVSGKTKLDIKMAEDSHMIDEVVVIGYGTMKVKDLTSAITTIKADEIAKTPASQPMQAMQGKVAGVQIVTTGTPGGSPIVRVRGIGSYPRKDAAGNPLTNENPLYVVDGVFYDNIDFLNPSDITSMSVLKDASAAAIYGVRAANGVVLIETKSGGYDKKTEITFDGYYGMQVAQNVLKMANTQQYVTMVNETGSVADAGFVAASMQRYGRSRVDPSLPDVNTDWYKEILRPAPVQNYSLDVSGGGSKASYSVGANYFSQQGILDMKNDYNRFNLRTKLDFKATSWLTVGGNALWSQATQYTPDLTVWNQAYYAVPILPVYDDLNTVASPVKYANAKDLGYRSGQNPFPSLDYIDNKHQINKLMASFYASVDLIPKKLILKTSYNQAYTDNQNRDVLLPYELGQGVSQQKSAITRRLENYSDKTWDNTLTYINDWGKHSLTAMVGTSYRDEYYLMLQAKGLDFETENEQSWYLHQSKTIVTDENGTRKVDDDGYHYYGMSYFGRLSYNYDSRYLLYATMRADGSSKYTEKWGYFPAIGAGWTISEEGFMKDIKAINYLKLRAGWGQLGNDKIPANDGGLFLNPVTLAMNNVLMSGTTLSGVYSELGWERSEETNIGISSRFLDNRLGVELDYYIRDSKNAGVDVPIPLIGEVVMKNVGVIRNSGFEAAVDWSDVIGKDWRYSIGGNISTLKNEVRDLDDFPYINGGSAEFLQRSIVGEPLLSFYGLQVEGVYQTQAEVDADRVASAFNAKQTDATQKIVPGYFKYKDANDDGVIDGDDRMTLGSYFPTFTYGANLNVGYKAFDLSVNIMGQTGNKILNRKRGQYIWTAEANYDADLAINRWHGEGTSNKYPSAAGIRNGWNQKMSNYFVEDGSFFRVQNIQLAYNIKNQRWFGAEMPNMRVTLTADRPLTVFKYNGFNPEVQDGVDEQAYPIPAVYTLGLNIKF